MLKVGVCQINIKPAKNFNDIEANTTKIIEYYNSTNADIVILPELCVCGYLPNDLLFCNYFVNYVLDANAKIASFTKDKILLLPTITKNNNGGLFNSVLILQDGKIIDEYNKICLPDDGVFQESRYFKSGAKTCSFKLKNHTFGVLICEDIWHQHKTYNPVHQLFTDINNIDSVIIVNASPFSIAKHYQRTEIVKSIADKYNVNVFYCNSVGSYDGILFDGSSIIINKNECKTLKSFEECAEICEVDNTKTSKNINIIHYNKELITYKALVFGLQNFVWSCGFKKVVIGLSGGADSALVAKLAVDAFGVDNVFLYGLKTKYTSSDSINDSNALVKNLQMKNFEIIDIEPLYTPYENLLKLEGLALQNIQARVRGNILMAKSSQVNGLVLTTGNKSEVACGYCTIYGDMCGAYNPIKDLYKTQVFELLKYINSISGDQVIPLNIIDKEPSAELAFNQKDSDNLPQYKVLDLILFMLIEMALSVDFIKSIKLSDKQILNDINNFIMQNTIWLDLKTVLNQRPKSAYEFLFNKEDVDKAYKLLNLSEYKRRQSALGSKVSIKSFEVQDWRYNIF